jgi:hypothetical protein
VEQNAVAAVGTLRIEGSLKLERGFVLGGGHGLTVAVLEAKAKLTFPGINAVGRGED